jgi:hypothetical protein
MSDRRRRFLGDCLSAVGFICLREQIEPDELSKLSLIAFGQSGQCLASQVVIDSGDRTKELTSMATPCSDYQETKGLIYFARMLDKIRLHGENRLDPGYFVGTEDPTFFDARCSRFLGVNYDELVERTLQGGSDEEILEWCFARGNKPSEEQIEVWNAFIAKRGWRDAGSADLQAAKERLGWAGRDDIQTWVDLHDAEEGRTPRR